MEEGIKRQIHIDIPRTSPETPLFQVPVVQECLERLLYIWSIRHPASGYVQGINDLATPFIVTFLQEYYPGISLCLSFFFALYVRRFES